jgi:hypothetical protein
MKRLIWLPIAGFLLVAGAAVAAAAPTITTVAQSTLSSLVDSDSDVEPTAGELKLGLAHGADLLDQVLADLVEAGTITQAQADAITDAMADELQSRRAAVQEEMELWQGFIEDGVITQDEVDQLPEDSPFREVFTSIAEDGQVDLDQLRELRPGFGPGRGHGHGPLWRMDVPAPDMDTETEPESETNTNS